MAISFALIGLGISGFISEFSTTSIILGLCIGSFVGYFVSGLTQAKGNMLQQDFVKLGDLRGKSLEEIIEKVGIQSSFRTCTITDRNNENGFFYTWAANNYSITLLFDSEKKCIGVNSETKI